MGDRITMAEYYENYNGYFRYKGENYGAKTRVKFAQSYLDTHTMHGKKIWKYGWFSNKLERDGKIVYVFWMCKCTYTETKDCYGHCFIDEKDLECAIEEIIDPVPITIVPRVKKKDYQSPEVMIGWCIYATAMLCFSIFNERAVAWFWISFYFFIWRNQKLWE